MLVRLRFLLPLPHLLLPQLFLPSWLPLTKLPLASPHPRLRLRPAWCVPAHYPPRLPCRHHVLGWTCRSRCQHRCHRSNWPCWRQGQGGPSATGDATRPVVPQAAAPAAPAVRVVPAVPAVPAVPDVPAVPAVAIVAVVSAVLAPGRVWQALGTLVHHASTLQRLCALVTRQRALDWWGASASRCRHAAFLAETSAWRGDGGRTCGHHGGGATASLLQ